MGMGFVKATWLMSTFLSQCSMDCSEKSWKVTNTLFRRLQRLVGIFYQQMFFLESESRQRNPMNGKEATVILR